MAILDFFYLQLFLIGGLYTTFQKEDYLAVRSKVKILPKYAGIH
jgi:hypothetical protein